MPSEQRAQLRAKLQEHQREMLRLTSILGNKPESEKVYLLAQVCKHRITAALLASQLGESVPA
jgi:hypothetical protein